MGSSSGKVLLVRFGRPKGENRVRCLFTICCVCTGLISRGTNFDRYTMSTFFTFGLPALEIGIPTKTNSRTQNLQYLEPTFRPIKKVFPKPKCILILEKGILFTNTYSAVLTGIFKPMALKAACSAKQPSRAVARGINRGHQKSLWFTVPSGFRCTKCR